MGSHFLSCQRRQKGGQNEGLTRGIRFMRELNRLSPKFVEQIKTAGVYRDGGGLLLRVEPTGTKRWVLRTTVKGRRRDVGLGSFQDVTLKEAREEAADLRRAARSGQDPVAKRRAARAGAISFEAAAEAVHESLTPTWRNEKHGAQWIATLRTYAFPFIGKMPVGDVESGDVLRVLAPIWLKKPETARRVRQRIHAVLEWAVAAGHRSASMINAADAVRAGLPKAKRKVEHHEAVPWQEIPKFIERVRAAPSFEAVRMALEFLLLTAARTSEVLLATWSEIDFETATWTVPANRMKAEEQHRVPLSPRAIELLNEARELWPKSRYLFPGRRIRLPLSNTCMLMLMRRLGMEQVPHGLRSSFRDWVADNRKDRDLAEKSLAHTLSSRVEEAYQRSDLLDQRRPLMREWANFVCGESPT